MAIAILFVLMAGLVLGVILVMLSVEFVGALAKGAPVRHPEQVSAATSTVREIPGFFVAKSPAPDVAASYLWSQDEFIDRLEGHLRSEQELVARFLLEPSIDSLYRQAPASLNVH